MLGELGIADMSCIDIQHQFEANNSMKAALGISFHMLQGVYLLWSYVMGIQYCHEHSSAEQMYLADKCGTGGCFLVLHLNVPLISPLHHLYNI